MSKGLSYACPSCGTEVEVGSACPKCPGKPKARPQPKRRSWEQSTSYDGLDLPEDGFDYDEFAARELGHKPHRQLGVKWYWWALGVGLLLMITIAAIMGMW